MKLISAIGGSMNSPIYKRCSCTAHVSYEAKGDTMRAILDRIEFCSLHAAAPAMLVALKLAQLNWRSRGPLATVGAVGQILKHINEAIALAEPDEMNQEKEREENEQP